MKNIKLIATSLAFLSLAGCQSRPVTGNESYKVYGEKVEDLKLINKVRHAFKASPTIPSELIHLSVDRGILQLSGFVHSHQEADLAILSARSIPEVKDVINSLVVMSSTDYALKRGVAASGTASR